MDALGGEDEAGQAGGLQGPAVPRKGGPGARNAPVLPAEVPEHSSASADARFEALLLAGGRRRFPWPRGDCVAPLKAVSIQTTSACERLSGRAPVAAVNKMAARRGWRSRSHQQLGSTTAVQLPRACPLTAQPRALASQPSTGSPPTRPLPGPASWLPAVPGCC